MASEKHVVAYGLVEMNYEKPDLKSTEDYHKLAKGFFENAKEYHEICEQAMPLLEKGSWALIVNACFACELYLKTLLLAEQYDFCKMKKPEKYHNLYDLFSHLSDEAKVYIKNYENLRQFSKFELELKEIGNGFAVIRYMLECRGMMVNVNFLFNFLYVLANACKHVITQIQTR